MSDAGDTIKAAIDQAQVLEDGAAGPGLAALFRPERDEEVPQASQMGGQVPPPPDGERAEGDDLACARLAMTDLGNAMRFVHRHGARFLFVPEWGWLAWDGRRWNMAEAQAMVARAVHDTIRAIAREAKALKASQFDIVFETKRNGTEVWRSDKLFAWCTASQGNAHVACIARLAQPYLTAAVKDFDADPMVFNVENGTLHFEKREEGDYVSLKRHDPGQRITKLAPVGFDPDAACPIYDAFLERMQPSADVRRHLHAWAGVSLTGIHLQYLMFWYGKGSNGKSTTIDTWHHVVGDYASTLPIETFLDQGRHRKGGDATPDIATLPGVRALRTSEPERSTKLAEGLVKQLTGGEEISARNLNQPFFKFRPAFKMVMSGNYKPKIEGTDDGIWRRVLLVLWGVKIQKSEEDTGLLDKLKGEAAGILNRMLDGLRDYLDHGLNPPEEVLAATQGFREESDPLGRWLQVCVRDAPGQRVQSSIAHKLFNAWSVANAVKPWSMTGFGKAMRERGYTVKQSNVMWFLDIELTRQIGDFVDTDGNARDIRAADDTSWVSDDADPPD